MRYLIVLVMSGLLFSGCKVNDSEADADVQIAGNDQYVAQDSDKNDDGLPDGDGADDEVTVPDADADGVSVGDGDRNDIDAADEDNDNAVYDPDIDDSDTEIPGDDDTVCPFVAEPEPAGEDPLNTVADAGVVEEVINGSFTDHFLYSNSAKTFKIGVREQWGSSIVFFGFANNANSNVIDANDTGREVQIAIYDPDRIMQNCAWNASCQTTPTECAGSITFLGWNPVQGGNRCNNGSPTEWITGGSGVMTASVVPYQWNPAWDRSDCFSDICSDNSYNHRLSDMRYIQKIRWVGSNVVEIKMTINNLTDIERKPTLQEFPTLYVPYGAHGLQNYNTLLDSTGTQVSIDVPANDGFYMKDFESPGGWTTLQMASKEYGVGIYYENRTDLFQGWQKAGVFNNVRSRITFGLPANGTVNARAYLILGSFDTVKSLAQGLDTSIAPFGYLDSPAEDAEIDEDSLGVGGWVLDNKGIAKVEVFIDDVLKGEVPVNAERADVCKVWPGYSMCPSAGYSGNIDISELTKCAHILEIKATDTDSNVRTIARKRFYKL